MTGMFNPASPGELLREEFLVPMGITAYASSSATAPSPK